MTCKGPKPFPMSITHPEYFPNPLPFQHAEYAGQIKIAPPAERLSSPIVYKSKKNNEERTKSRKCSTEKVINAYYIVQPPAFRVVVHRK